MKILLMSFFLVMTPLVSAAAESDPLLVKKDGEVVQTIDPGEYAFSFIINESKLEVLLDQLNDQVYQKPVDASLDDEGNIVSGKPGTALDKRAFELAFRKFVYQGKPSEMELPMRRVYPRVDSELLSEIREKEIGDYVTHFKKDNKERVTNIKLATDAINNQVVFPGETFSFNKTVGERTEEKGYKRAPVIEEGELTEDIGGGICQLSSTLYNAVDVKGIEIVERYSHSRSVPYVPPGRDATVSWWGPDFSFKNKLSQPILIRAKADDGEMRIKIYSSVHTREPEN
ncbi:MAG TPA: VanW family protein [Virgibacillus sp.]|nr:VanW family protein [Virgibacillus sp.]HLR68042.1 VanW family protein [Virgibacillus sp.]